MEIRPGYKITEVGLVPEDWEVCNLSRLVASGPKNGYSARSAKNARGTPTLTLTATSSGRIVLNEETIKYLEETLNPHSDILLKPGDVLVQRSNTSDLVGTTAIFDGPGGVYAYPDLMMRLRFHAPETAHWFWRYANSANGRRYFNSVAAGSTGTMPKISGDKLRNMPLPLAKSSEQHIIATVLGDVDALLEVLNRLVAKKRDLKEAAMQQLLTGQTRLPGFTCEWTSSRFGMLASPRKQRVDPRRSSQSLYCIELEHIESGAGCLLSFGETSSTSSQKSIFEKDDILFGRLRAYLKKYWLADRSGVCSTEIWVLEVNHALAAPSYLAQIVQLGDFIKAASSSYGTHMPRSDWNVVKEFELSMPELDEQNAVAEVLSSMDAEIAALEQRLAKTRDLKQAMMQELLTGKTRLVAQESVHA